MLFKTLFNYSKTVYFYLLKQFSLLIFDLLFEETIHFFKNSNLFLNLIVDYFYSSKLIKAKILKLKQKHSSCNLTVPFPNTFIF